MLYYLLFPLRNMISGFTGILQNGVQIALIK